MFLSPSTRLCSVSQSIQRQLHNLYLYSKFRIYVRNKLVLNKTIHTHCLKCDDREREIKRGDAHDCVI